MKIRLTRDVNIPGGLRRAGEVIETEAWVAERLLAKEHAVPFDEIGHPSPDPETRDPEPEHRDPPVKARKGKAK